MSQTLAQKIIARAAGKNIVQAGEIATCKVDLAMIHDSGGPRRVKPILDHLGVKVWDSNKVVVVSDHFVPAFDQESAAILKGTREWVRSQAISRFYDQQGICHVVLPERGNLSPGLFVVGGDSHSPTGGAFGCFMFGMGATDMAGVLATGETWVKVPETILIRWSGKLQQGVCAKDMALFHCAQLGMDGGDYQVVEYTGETISDLDMEGRMTVCNMAAELGAQTGMIAADHVTHDYINTAGGELGPYAELSGDDDASYRIIHEFNADGLEPQVAAPHSPAKSTDVSNVEQAALDQCYIGACTGAKLEDLQAAAEILKGHEVASSTRLLIAPASTRVTAQAAADGTLAVLTKSGAIMMPSGCGACAGYGAGQLAEDEVCLSSTARNFQGRMGAKSSMVYLSSPATVAASAIKGYITDPREFLSSGDAQ
jgi:3-isopropylmalate/(R)-2-methylmalate dehydratase large subunit